MTKPEDTSLQQAVDTQPHVEPIILNFPNLNFTYTLPPDLTLRIWDAVKRGRVSSAEEYVHQLLDQALDTMGLGSPNPTDQPVTPESTPSE